MGMGYAAKQISATTTQLAVSTKPPLEREGVLSYRYYLLFNFDLETA
jgi:hypothetical protein